jgi:hypothetical protein
MVLMFLEERCENTMGPMYRPCQQTARTLSLKNCIEGQAAKRSVVAQRSSNLH